MHHKGDVHQQETHPYDVEETVHAMQVGLRE
jgi:hypothetical protein